MRTEFVIVDCTGHGSLCCCFRPLSVLSGGWVLISRMLFQTTGTEGMNNVTTLSRKEWRLEWRLRHASTTMDTGESRCVYLRYTWDTQDEPQWFARWWAPTEWVPHTAMIYGLPRRMYACVVYRRWCVACTRHLSAASEYNTSCLTWYVNATSIKLLSIKYQIAVGDMY